MTEEQFATWSTYILIGGLMLWMCFIMWKLGKESKAGKYGTMVIFFALGTGMTGLIIKTVVTYFMGK